MRNSLLFLCLAVVSSALALPKKAPPKPVRPPTQNEGEFCLSGFVPSAAEGVKVPLEPNFGVVTFDAADQEARLAKAIEAKGSKVPLKTLLKDRDFVTKTLALDALRTAGVTNVEALVRRNAKYGTFLKAFLQDPVFMRHYAGAGLVPSDTEVGLRVMAHIWARVMGSLGANLPSPLPSTIFLAAAQLMAPAHQEPGSTSVNALWLLSTFAPSNRDRTTTNIARVMFRSGEKVVSEVPRK